MSCDPAHCGWPLQARFSFASGMEVEAPEGRESRPIRNIALAFWIVSLLTGGACGSGGDSTPGVPHQSRRPDQTPEDAAGHYFDPGDGGTTAPAAGHGPHDPGSAPTGSAYSRATDLGGVDDSLAPVLTPSRVREAFVLARDKRFIVPSSNPGFRRRASWLYPDDGCFARADLAGRELETSGFTRPAKVFAFGPLEMKTPNSPDGVVFWWYHVALAYRIQTGGRSSEEILVIDPAGRSDGPVPLGEWARLISTDPAQVSFAICAANTYEPANECVAPKASHGRKATRDEKGFLELEWDRQSELGRDPVRVLGDSPPWLGPV